MQILLLVRILVVLLSIGLASSKAAAQSRPKNEPLTNAAVVRLVRAGFKEKTVIAIIGSRPADFDLSTDRMVELKRSGISERLILAMLARQEGTDLPDDFWSEDPFYDSAKGANGSSARDPIPQGNSTDLFGSGGGVSGSTKSRGGSGSISSDTETTGSATVRIIRPPAEAGASPKLYKTPALTNNSIIELVEAGFSEGTIVRRIEQSPVEFDLSPEKLAELRKCRVSNKIVAAMKAAMGDDSGVSKTAPASNGTREN